MWPVVFAVTNVSDGSNEVVIERRVGGQWIEIAGPTLLGALETVEYERRAAADIVYWGVTEEDNFRIRMTAPAIAHQFTSGAGGASSLVPSTAWDWDYFVVGIGVGEFTDQAAHYAFIVAREDDTTVDVTLGVSGVHSGPGIPAGNTGGDNFQVVLQAGQSLGLFSEGGQLLDPGWQPV